MPNQAFCARDPARWDLDQASMAQLRAAKWLCGQCPLLAACSRHLADRLATHDPPVSMIQAGFVFGARGGVLEDEQAVRNYLRGRRSVLPSRRQHAAQDAA